MLGDPLAAVNREIGLSFSPSLIAYHEHEPDDLTGSGLSTDVKTQLKTMLDGTVASKLSDEENVIDATQNVVEDVKKEGRPAGGCKMLWGGIRETIKSIPVAL